VTNQFYTGTPTSRRQINCPSSIVSGEPLLVGKLPCVALDNYQANIGGTTVLLGGSFTLTVVGESSESPGYGLQINPGDYIYARGTYDATTNVTYNLTLDGNSLYPLFGYLDPDPTANPSSILANVTNTSAVVLLHHGL
jgi:hypothetical protein